MNANAKKVTDVCGGMNQGMWKRVLATTLMVTILGSGTGCDLRDLGALGAAVGRIGDMALLVLDELEDGSGDDWGSDDWSDDGSYYEDDYYDEDRLDSIANDTFDNFIGEGIVYE